MRLMPRNKIEQWLFFDMRFYYEDVAKLWDVGKRELDAIMESPYEKMSVKMMEEVASLCNREVEEVVRAVRATRPVNFRGEIDGEYMRWMKIKNEG